MFDQQARQIILPFCYLSHNFLVAGDGEKNSHCVASESNHILTIYTQTEMADCLVLPFLILLIPGICIFITSLSLSVLNLIKVKS